MNFDTAWYNSYSMKQFDLFCQTSFNFNVHNIYLRGRYCCHHNYTYVLLLRCTSVVREVRRVTSIVQAIKSKQRHDQENFNGKNWLRQCLWLNSLPRYFKSVMMTFSNSNRKRLSQVLRHVFLLLQKLKKNTHTQTVGRPTFFGCQNRLLAYDITGTITCRPWVTPPCLQAALILTFMLFIPSGSSISQDDLVSSRSTSGGVQNIIFGNPRLLLRIGIVGVIVISFMESAQASTVTTVGWN